MWKSVHAKQWFLPCGLLGFDPETCWWDQAFWDRGLTDPTPPAALEQLGRHCQLICLSLVLGRGWEETPAASSKGCHRDHHRAGAIWASPRRYHMQQPCTGIASSQCCKWVTVALCAPNIAHLVSQERHKSLSWTERDFKETAGPGIWEDMPV